MDTINKILETTIEQNKPEIRKCDFCGKPYEWYELKVLNRTSKVLVPACNCMDVEEKRKEAEKKAIHDKEILAKKFENSLMTPFFRNKTFDNLQKNEHYRLCFKYAVEFNPNEHQGILMIGNPGTGKTSLLAAICNNLITRGYNCLFITFSALLDKFMKHSYENAGDISTLLNWLVKFDFIAIDDIGRENYTDRRKEIAFRIIDTILNYQITAGFTANPEMITKLQNIPDWEAILDRLKDICVVQMSFKGQSLRG